MTAKSVISGNIGAMASAALLLVVSLAWAPSAQAQLNGEDPDPDQLACLVYEGLFEAGQAQCDAVGCDPSPGDCEKICKTARQACDRTNKGLLRALRTTGKSIAKQARILCRTAPDRKFCKSGSKLVNGEVKDFLKQLARALKAACSASGIQADCSTSCNQDVPFPTCGILTAD